jgi:hypothetical protein
MLETVKGYINDLPKLTFSEFFIQYMISIQDANIDRELNSLVNHNNMLDSVMIDRLINETIEGLKDII